MLKKSGRIPTLASPRWSRQALTRYYRDKSRAYNGNSGTLAVKGARYGSASSKKIRLNGTARPGDRVPTLLLKEGRPKRHYRARCARDKILAIPGGLPRLPEEQRYPELTKMYYPDYQPGAPTTICCSRQKAMPADGEHFISMRQFYEQQSQSYSVLRSGGRLVQPGRTRPTTATTRTETAVRELVKGGAGAGGGESRHRSGQDLIGGSLRSQ